MRILKLTAAAPYPATTPIQSHRDTYQNKMASKVSKPKQSCPTCGKCFVNVELHITKAHDDYKAEVSYHACGEPKACVLYKNGVVIERFTGFWASNPDDWWGASDSERLFWKYDIKTKHISFHHKAGGPKGGIERHPGNMAFKNYTLVKASD